MQCADEKLKSDVERCGVFGLADLAFAPAVTNLPGPVRRGYTRVADNFLRCRQSTKVSEMVVVRSWRKRTLGRTGRLLVLMWWTAPARGDESP
jgi:hypothetical protein